MRLGWSTGPLPPHTTLLYPRPASPLHQYKQLQPIMKSYNHKHQHTHEGRKSQIIEKGRKCQKLNKFNLKDSILVCLLVFCYLLISSNNSGGLSSYIILSENFCSSNINKYHITSGQTVLLYVLPADRNGKKIVKLLEITFHLFNL